ncbi:hypothetical protein ACGF7W_32990 [Streptomyces sp. NPDC048219]|uniref:hypothetical protein n=1 Tax=Streptomyces TaxID=1883 RepID=UPI0004CC7E68|nr:hypothetical protein [Streptomyces anulatus]
MEPVWNGMLTCDYERSRPASTLLEWDLYTTSLIAWPRVLLEDPTPYGRLRRPGIVDIDEPVHLRLVAALEKFLSDPDRVRDLADRTALHREQTASALDQAEQALSDRDVKAADEAIGRGTAAFLKVMSAHIVNWLLPEQQWEDLLSQVLSSRARARDCTLALATPNRTGHLLQAHRLLLEAAASIRDGRPLALAAADVSARAGTLYGAGSPAAAAMPLEDPDRAADLLRTLSSSADPESELASLTGSLDRSAAVREAWETAALLAAGGRPGQLAAVRALSTALAWAADSEERRKELRHRYLSLVRRWCTAREHDATRVTTPDLLALGDGR